jgi:hypothetical protein
MPLLTCALSCLQTDGSDAEFSRRRSMHFEEFAAVVTEAGLPELARRDLFRMFDVNNTGAQTFVSAVQEICVLIWLHYDGLISQARLI